jgi:hypothetical protein
VVYSTSGPGTVPRNPHSVRDGVHQTVPPPLEGKLGFTFSRYLTNLFPLSGVVYSTSGPGTVPRNPHSERDGVHPTVLPPTFWRVNLVSLLRYVLRPTGSQVTCGGGTPGLAESGIYDSRVIKVSMFG